MARKTDPIGVRFTPEAREAIEQAAKEDGRPVSQLIAKIVTDWLKAKGFLPR